MKDIAEKGQVSPSSVPKLDDDKFDKKYLTLVNKIEEIDEAGNPVKIKSKNEEAAAKKTTKS